MTSKQINIRRLNELGMKEFKKHLVQKILPNRSLVEDDIYTETIQSIGIKIDKEKSFNDRHELAKYIHRLISSIISTNKSLKNDWGMWAWFALLYIDQLTNNGNKINKYDNYIPVLRGPRSKLLYRHCVYGPYQAYEDFDDDMKIFLSKKIYSMGACWEDMMSNNILRNSDSMFEVFKNRYLDSSTGYVITGSNNKVDKPKPGNPWKQSELKAASGKIRRFKAVIGQFQTTQRIENMSDKDIEILLPKPEFN